MELIGELQIAVGTERDALAPLAAYKLDLKGPSISLQTFCSTSLVAVHLACQSLLAFECDTALAGGVAIENPMGVGYLYLEGGILSPDGECRAFDVNSKGSVTGNGVGLVVLKRLEDAVRDGDHIYAVIRGSAVGNDGIARAGFTAPGVDGQAAVIAAALGNAGVEVESINYIETHGTGTPLGDSVELAAMLKVFRQKTDRKGFCGIGSMKPNVGHLDRAAGVANLIKVALALHNKQIPPSLNFERPSPALDLANSPFYVNAELRAWSANGQWPRRAGASSFGLGGTNAHVVLEEAPLVEPSTPSRPHQLLLLSAKNEVSLEIATSNLAAYLEKETACNLADVAYTLQVGRGEFNHRRVLVCSNSKDAAGALAISDPNRVFSAQQTRRDRPVAFLFPGLGDHYVDMGRALYETEPIFRKWVDRCAELHGTALGEQLGEVLHPFNGKTHRTALETSQDLGRMSRETEKPLQRSVLAQSDLFIVEYTLAQLLIAWGIRPQAVIGYSLGDYVAACVAGILSLEDALRLVVKRALLVHQLQPGAMLVVALPEKEMRPFLTSGIAIAAILTPAMCVVSGPMEQVDALYKQVEASGIGCRYLCTSHAFHSPMMLPIVADFMELLKPVAFHPPEVPILSNLTGRWIGSTEVSDATY